MSGALVSLCQRARAGILRWSLTLAEPGAAGEPFGKLVDNRCAVPYNCPDVVAGSDLMAVKTDRMEARVSPEERERIERAASVAGLSVSAFLVNAAVERADEIIAETTTTIVPADYFDDLLAALDEPQHASRLTKVAKQAHRRRRLQAR